MKASHRRHRPGHHGRSTPTTDSGSSAPTPPKSSDTPWQVPLREPATPPRRDITLPPKDFLRRRHHDVAQGAKGPSTDRPERVPVWDVACDDTTDDHDSDLRPDRAYDHYALTKSSLTTPEVQPTTRNDRPHRRRARQGTTTVAGAPADSATGHTPATPAVAVPTPSWHPTRKGRRASGPWLSRPGDAPAHSHATPSPPSSSSHGPASRCTS
jgi:hypothetical protein